MHHFLLSVGIFFAVVITLSVLDALYQRRRVLYKWLRVARHMLLGIRASQRPRFVHPVVDYGTHTMPSPQRKRTNFATMSPDRHRAASAKGGAAGKGKKRHA